MAKLELELSYGMYDKMKDNLLEFIEIEIMQGSCIFEENRVLICCEITDQTKIQILMEVTNRLMFHYDQTQNLN